MLARVARRLSTIVLLLLGIFLVAKGLVRALPGDPVDAILAETGANLDPETLRRDLGLDRPYWSATASQLSSLLLRFDWGDSISMKRPIGPLLLERTEKSALLGAAALFTTLLFSFASAFFANLPHRARPALRSGLRAISAIGIALPTAWIGPLLALFLAVKWKLFVLSGGFALPVLTLSLGLSGFWLRAFSETLERELRSDVVRTARAKGAPESAVAWKHAFLPAAGSLLAFLGSQTGALFAGTVITETIFDRPGLGSLLVEAIFKRDYPLIESLLLVSSTLILVGNLAGDLLQIAVHPRLRSALGEGK
jgi:ABC-type dipeptide/oligopeptide/nickel transport system permease component